MRFQQIEEQGTLWYSRRSFRVWFALCDDVDVLQVNSLSKATGSRHPQVITY